LKKTRRGIMTKVSWVENLIFIFVASIVAFIMYSTYRWVQYDGIELFSTTSPLIFPFLIGIVMFVCLISTIIVETKNSKEATNSNETSDEFLYDLKRVVIYTLGVIVYALVIKKIGFLVGTVVYLIIAMTYMNYEEQRIEKKAGRAAIVSFVAVPLLYFVFYKIFHVMLP
jgi:hypothetical protein